MMERDIIAFGERRRRVIKGRYGIAAEKTCWQRVVIFVWGDKKRFCIRRSYS
jgi:hypothetical protein